MFFFTSIISFDLRHEPMKWVLLLVSPSRSLFKVKKLGEGKRLNVLASVSW